MVDGSGGWKMKGRGAGLMGMKVGRFLIFPDHGYRPIFPSLFPNGLTSSNFSVQIYARWLTSVGGEWNNDQCFVCSVLCGGAKLHMGGIDNSLSRLHQTSQNHSGRRVSHVLLRENSSCDGCCAWNKEVKKPLFSGSMVSCTFCFTLKAQMVFLSAIVTYQCSKYICHQDSLLLRQFPGEMNSSNNFRNQS